MADKGNPQKISPMTWVLIIVGVPIIIYMFLSTYVFKPESTENTSQPVAAKTGQTNRSAQPTRVNQVTQPVNQAADEKNDQSVPVRLATADKNPFNMPAMYRDDFNKPDAAQNDFSRGREEKNTAQPTAEELRYSAVFEQQNDKLALIYAGNFGHVLRENDLIPKTEYTVKTIGSGQVILVHKNGSAKVLKLRGDK